MKLRLTLLAALVLTLCACDAPLWANWEIFILAGEEIVGGPHYCIAWDRQGVMFSCEQPENHVKVIELEDEDHTLQVWRINQVMP